MSTALARRRRRRRRWRRDATECSCGATRRSLLLVPRFTVAVDNCFNFDSPNLTQYLVLILGALECLQVPVQVVITGDTSKSEVPTIAKAVGEPLTPIVWRCIENAARNPARFTADKGPGFLKMVGECVLHVGSTKPCEQCAVIL